MEHRRCRNHWLAAHSVPAGRPCRSERRRRHRRPGSNLWEEPRWVRRSCRDPNLGKVPMTLNYDSLLSCGGDPDTSWSPCPIPTPKDQLTWTPKFLTLTRVDGADPVVANGFSSPARCPVPLVHIDGASRRGAVAVLGEVTLVLGIPAGKPSTAQLKKRRSEN